MDALRPAGKNDPARPKIYNLFRRDIPGKQFGIYACFTDPPGNQLAVLGPEIKNQDAILIRTCRYPRR